MGLHSNLIRLESEFKTDDDVSIAQHRNLYEVVLTEEITLWGEPITKSSDQYPLLQAAKWAIIQTDDVGTREHLQQYIESITKNVNESIANGFQVVFVVKHNIEVEIQNEELRIVRDTFTDKSNDNIEGFDNVTWSGIGFERQKPDWTQFPDYEMYNTPIDVIGRALLSDFASLEAKASISTSNGFYYNRTNAGDYITQYTSNPSYYDYCGDHIRQDTSKYNSAYEDVWGTTGCDDCTDYVSQALHYGGFPTDDTWYPNAYNPPWVRVNGLKEYLEGIHAGYMVESKFSLQVGDLAYKYDSDYALPWRHVVMVSHVNPYLYSAHTHDRRNYSWNPTLNRYMHIRDFIARYQHFLPLLLNDANSRIPKDNFQNPYPAPLDPITLPQPYPAP